MKKVKQIQNSARTSVDAMLAGYYFQNSKRIRYDAKHKIIYRSSNSNVSLISGGGSGHEPADFGYVGSNLLTASVNGDFFNPPKPGAIIEAIKKTDRGKGVLLIVKNFPSDMDSFTKAKVIAEKAGHKVEIVCVSDDHSVENTSTYSKRHRGVAGTILIHKILGALAEKGMPLSDLKNVGEQLNANLFTLGVALEGAVLPETQHPMFELNHDEVYFGVGIHGEEGYRKVPYHSSEQLAIELFNKMKHLTDWNSTETYAVLVNGLGSTTLMEQYIFTHDLSRLFKIEDVNTAFVKVGSYLTSYNMHGISLTLLRLPDPSWLTALEEYTDASHW